jgi:Histidine kinase-, DNA gyrase B-, and HSP90-like ATPase
MFRLIMDPLPFMTRMVLNSGFAEAAHMSRISEDDSGNLWLALTTGVYMIRNPEITPELKLEKVSIPENNSEPVSIFYDRRGDFWIGFKNSTVMKYEPAKKAFITFTLPATPPLGLNSVVTVIGEDKKGKKWFATAYHGISKREEDGKAIEQVLSNEKITHTRLTGLVELMKRNAQRLMRLVDQLLVITRLDVGKMIINLSEDDIVKCLKILLYEYLSAAEGKQIRYIVDMPEYEFITWFDRDKIEKIVSNLLSNALKYTPIHGTIQCKIKIDHKEKNRNQALLKIVVPDSGPGITDENLKRIFDRFFRVEGIN